MTYGQLDKMLLGLGFQSRIASDGPKARVYEHRGSGAMLIFPFISTRKKVLPHHIGAVRGTLKVYGIASPDQFAGEMQQAS